MPKKIPEHELDAIVAIVGAHPDGVRVEVIREGLPVDLPPRMLQRRLAFLIEQKRLVANGRGRGRCYQLPSITTGTAGLPVDKAPAVLLEVRDLPLSPKAQNIQKSIRKPVQNRKPVGYNREFLNQYRPNRSFYLSEKVRRGLFEAGRPVKAVQPAGTYAKTIWNRLLIDLSWNSSRLEGNTYSLLETERLLQLGQVAAGKNAKEAQMIVNHRSAIELLVDQAEEIGFNRYTILNLHALLADNLLEDPQAVGRVRHIPVTIGGSVYHPLEAPQLIEECFDQVLNTATAINDPFEQAFFVSVHIPYLQPFEDVNKRVSRLAANIPLIRHNLSPLSFVDVPAQTYVDALLGVYELNRIELLRDVFVWAYERSCARYSAVQRSLGEPDPFRQRLRELIGETINAVVIGRMHKQQATAHIRKLAEEKLNQADRLRFLEVVETELMSLHEGNIARYRIKPSEYANWQKNWK